MGFVGQVVGFVGQVVGFVEQVVGFVELIDHRPELTSVAFLFHISFLLTLSHVHAY